MKFRYSKEKKFRVIYPIDLHVEKGTEYETTDPELQDILVEELGFHKVEVKKDKKQEGDK